MHNNQPEITTAEHQDNGIRDVAITGEEVLGLLGITNRAQAIAGLRAWGVSWKCIPDFIGGTAQSCRNAFRRACHKLQLEPAEMIFLVIAVGSVAPRGKVQQVLNLLEQQYGIRANTTAMRIGIGPQAPKTKHRALDPSGVVQPRHKR